MDSKYRIIKFVKDLPHPSYPRVLCVPETWITVCFEINNKVAVILPAEEFSVTENRIKSKESPKTEEWSLKIVVSLLRADDFDSAFETARELNRKAMQEEGQLQLANSQESLTENQHSKGFEVGEKSAEKKQKNENESEKVSKENEQLSENKLQKEFTDNQQENENKLEKNLNQNMVESEKDSAENQQHCENESQENQQENEFEENLHQNAVESDKGSVENEHQSDSESEENQQDSGNELGENQHQNTIEAKENSVEYSHMLYNSWQPSMTDSDSEENLDESSDESWHASAEESEQSSGKESKNKAQRPTKRATHEETKYHVNQKKRKLMKTSYPNYLDTPSTSKAVSPTYPSQHTPLIKNLYRKKEKRITARKFLKRLSSIYKKLEYEFGELDKHLQSLGSVSNKLTELNSNFIHLVALSLFGDDNMDSNSSSKLESENNYIFQTSEMINKYMPNDKQQNNDNVQAYEYPDNTDKSMKWTLTNEEFKPKPGFIELLPRSGIYVSEERLQECIKEAEYTRYEHSFNRLAKLLLFEIFKSEAIRKCSLFPRKNKTGKLRLDHYASCILMLYVKDFCSRHNLSEKMDETLTIKAIQKKMYDFKNKCIDEERYGGIKYYNN